MLSHELWQSAFGAREDLVGRTIEVDGVRHEVIGIMPAGFDLMDGQRGVVAAAPARSCHSPVSRESLPLGVGPFEERRHAGTGRGGAVASLIASWGERVARADTCSPPADTSCRWRRCWTRSSVRRGAPLAAPGRRRTGAAHRVRESRQPPDGPRRDSGPEVAVRTALGASRRRLLRSSSPKGSCSRAWRGARPRPRPGGVRAYESPIQRVFPVSPTLESIRRCLASRCSSAA